MKRTKIILTILAILVVTALAGCSAAVGPDVKEADKTGTVSVSVPALNPRFAELLAGTSSRSLTSERAFIASTSANFIFYNTITAISTTFPVTPNQTIQQPGTTTSLLSKDLLAGTYNLTVNIYNSFTDNTNPVVTGYAYNIVVTPGMVTPVTVTCIPNNAVSLAGKTSISPYTNQLSIPWVMTQSGPPTSFGAEGWYRFIAENAKTRIKATRNGASAASLYMVLFDSNGNYLADVAPEDGTTTLEQDTSVGMTYYLAMADMGVGDSRSFNLWTEVGTTSTTIQYGNPAQFTGSNNWSGNYIFGIPISISTGGTLTNFGTWSLNNTSYMRMALYADNQGQPGNLVASTASTLMTIGKMEIAPSSSVTLAAGTYWLMAVYDRDTLVAVDWNNYVNNIRYYYSAYTNTLPSPLTGSSSYSHYNLNYYITVTPGASQATYQSAGVFNIGEDTSTMGWSAYGGSLYSVYTVSPGGQSWRLWGDGSSYIQMTMPVNPSALSYKIEWQTSGWYHDTYADVFVNDTLVKSYLGEYMGGGAINEIIVPNTFNASNLTIKFKDNPSYINSNATFTGAYLWLYQMVN